jgi:hypothetical protein
VSVAIVPRDRFSTTRACVANVIATVDEEIPIEVILGNAPPSVAADLRTTFGSRIDVTEVDTYLSTSQSRNVALESCTTELLALVDSDSYPREGWLEPLVARQVATGAGAVVGVILESPTKIHCAGTSFYVDEHDGHREGWKVLHCYGMPFHGATNLPAREVDYGEQHAHLVSVAAMRSIGGFDPDIGEGSEVDTGLALTRAGYASWFEPESVTFFNFDGPVGVDDIDFFTWRWDADNIVASYRAFEDKWGASLFERQSFREFLAIQNSQVGWLPRRLRHPLAFRLSRLIRRAIGGTVWVPPKARSLLRRRRWAPGWPG